MVNDTSIIFGIILFFVVIGTILPLTQQAFGETEFVENDAGVLVEKKDVTFENETTLCLEEQFNWIFLKTPITNCYNKEEVDVEKIRQRQESSWLSLVTNIGQIFFWTFGAIPFYIDLFLFTPLRLLLGFLIYRSIRSGAG